MQIFPTGPQKHKRNWEQMPKMCAFARTAEKGDMVHVNPRAVLYVRPGSPGYTTIYFDNDVSLSVAVPTDQVIHALNIAMNADQI